MIKRNVELTKVKENIRKNIWVMNIEFMYEDTDLFEDEEYVTKEKGEIIFLFNLYLKLKDKETPSKCFDNLTYRNDLNNLFSNSNEFAELRDLFFLAVGRKMYEKYINNISDFISHILISNDTYSDNLYIPTYISISYYDADGILYEASIK